MTRGAIEMRKIAQSDKENKRNIEMKTKELADKEKQRKFDAKEHRKDRFNKLVTSGMGLLKLPKFNDPSWYKQFLTDLSRATNLPTYQRLGAESFSALGLVYKADNGGSSRCIANPGLLVIDFIPTTGPQNGAISIAQKFPINQALNRTKEQVLKSNSRSNVSWEGSDIGLNIFCTADIYEGLHEVKRALLIYQTYRGDNSYLAQSYLRALGWDYSDLDTNVAKYREQLYKVAKKFNSSIVAPANLSIYHRRAYLAGNVFADRDGTVKQVYMFKQRMYHILNATGDGTAIRERNTDSNTQLMSTFLTWLDDMIESITANPDFVEMYADLRSSISDLLEFDGTIDPKGEIEFNHDELNRAQIHNIRTVPRQRRTYPTVGMYNTLDWSLHINSNGYLYQGNSDGTTKRNFYWSTTSQTTDQVNAFKMYLQAFFDDNAKYPFLLDMDKDDIDGDDILEITRGLFTGYQSTSANGTTLEIHSCGTEIFYQGLIWTMDLTTGSMTYYHYSTENVSYRSTGSLTLECGTLSLATKFDWAPMTNYYHINDNVYTPVTVDNIVVEGGLLTDLDHAFIIGKANANELNEACVLSEFYLVTSQFKH